MISYTIRRSSRVKYLRLTVLPGGSVVLTAPTSLETSSIEKFLYSRRTWIERNVQRMQNYIPLQTFGRRDYVKHKEAARALVHERLAFWNEQYGYTYGRVAIKNTRRTWGSCSRKGNLNFSFAILFLPRELADYIIVHELCHLKEHNHGAVFWKLVEQTISDYQERRKILQKFALKQG